MVTDIVRVFLDRISTWVFLRKGNDKLNTYIIWGRREENLLSDRTLEQPKALLLQSGAGFISN